MMNEPIKMEVSQQQLEKELQRVAQQHKRNSTVKSIILWSLIIAACAAAVSALWFPVVWVENPRQFVLTQRTEAFCDEDLAVWKHGDDMSVLTVKGIAGEHLVRDEMGNLIWQGEVMHGVNIPDGITAVAEGHVLLLDQAAGAIYDASCEEIIGKVLFQIGPLPLNQ